MKKKLIDLLCELQPPPDLQKANQRYDMFCSGFKKSINSNLYYNTINNNSNIRNFLKHIFGISDFLSLCINKNLDYFFSILDNSPEDSLELLINDINSTYTNFFDLLIRENSKDKAKKYLFKELRIIKQKISLLVATNDLGKTWSLTKVIENLSYLADNLIRVAVNCLLLESNSNGDFSSNNLQNPSKNSSYFILALGKLGGKELNYSSDVDLIALYDDNINTNYLGTKSTHEFFINITKSLVRILSERTEDGYVFRTDFRLRPDAGATPLALSVSAAETYYESVGQNWERAALIKARPIAGDIIAGNEFLKNLKPFIWRKNLDYAAISDIKSIKRQIDTKENNSDFKIDGYNLKLGKGGIREIEFFAQTQQLIYGGRNHSIRTLSTINALKELKKNNYITNQACNELIDSYIFFRILEHRIQMISDEQTHSMPSNNKKIFLISVFFGLRSLKELENELFKKINNTQKHYKKLFKDSSPLASNHGSLVFTGTEDDPDTLVTLNKLGFSDSKIISKIIREWHHSRYRATRSIRAREILTDMIPKILFEFSKTSQPEVSFKKFDRFLSKLPEGVQLFSLFQSNPNLLNLLSEILSSAPNLSEFLENSPNVLDIFISDDFNRLDEKNYLYNDLDNLLSYYDNFQDILDQTRRWCRERRFQIGIQLLRGKITGLTSAKLFTNLAIIIIKSILKHTYKKFKSEYGEVLNSEFAILGLGTLGSKEMNFGSDLDLIFIYDNQKKIIESNGKRKLSTSKYFARLSQQFISSISSLTSEGRIYEIDMRLRPSGNSGPIATSINSFEEYHSNSSWTWEKMALTRATPVAGDKNIIKKINKTIIKVLSKKNDQKKILTDVLSMKNKIHKEQKRDKWHVKDAKGGLLDIQFISQYLQLVNASKYPDILDQNINNVFIKLKDKKILDMETADNIVEISNIQFNIYALICLCYKDNLDPINFNQEIYLKLFKILKVENKKDLNIKLESIQSAIQKSFKATTHL